MTEVLEEAWEMVDHEWIDEDDFRDFVFTFPVEFFTRQNPGFFDGTVVEAEVARCWRSRGRPLSPRHREVREMGATRATLDILLRGADIVDGTGAPRAARRRRHPRRPHRARRRPRRCGRRLDACHRRRGHGRRTRVRRHPHALRRAGAVGPAVHAVAVPRRHDRHRRQLRVHDRADHRRRRRLPHAHDGDRRGHVPRLAAGRPRVGLALVRRVARPHRRQARRERRLPRRPLDHAPCRDG